MGILRKFCFLAILFTVFLSVNISNVNAQQIDYKYHSLFMYNFTRYIKWPEDALKDEFVIGVIGRSGITEHLEKMAQSKNVNGKPIVVKTFKNADEIADCHMLFIPDNYSNKFEDIRKKLAGKYTLVISERPGLAQKGSDINFVVNNGKWNFEMNQASTDSRNLKVSSELSKFAHKIYTEI